MIYKLICGKQRFFLSVCVNLCLSTLLLQFFANIAFQPVMLVVLEKKAVYGSIIEQSKSISSRLHSVRFCIFHWKAQEVLYGDLCLCKVGNEAWSKMCASRFYCSITGISGVSYRLSSQWGKGGHKNSWIWGVCTRRSFLFSVCRRPLNPSSIFFSFIFITDLSGKYNCVI